MWQNNIYKHNCFIELVPVAIKKPLEDNVAATFDEYLAFVFERYYQDKLPFTEIATSTSTLEEKIVVGLFFSLVSKHFHGWKLGIQNERVNRNCRSCADTSYGYHFTFLVYLISNWYVYIFILFWWENSLLTTWIGVNLGFQCYLILGLADL